MCGSDCVVVFVLFVVCGDDGWDVMLMMCVMLM